MEGEPAAAWHQALVYAVTGQRRPELGLQQAPDLDVVVAEVGESARGAHPVPADLTAGIGAARFAAVLAALRARLATQGRPVLAERAPDADERRLLADVPPHHGA
jgi:hypothetical protein